MTQPDKPVPARGTRPQLFGEPSASKPSKSRHPDFGPSILATIDGTPRRDSRARDATPLKRVLWMSLLALAGVAVYFGVKFGMLSSGSSSPERAVLAVQAPPPAEKVAEPVATAVAVVQVSSAASASGGAASIETVAAPVVAAAASSAESPAPAASNVAASLNNIQQVLARADAPEPRKTAKPVATKEAPAAAKDTASAKDVHVAATRGASPEPKPSSKPANDDAELIAAMLPHLKRRGTTPTSPNYEKRCGQLDGDAAVDCRVKFCNGREGVDPACPSAVSR